MAHARIFAYPRLPKFAWSLAMRQATLSPVRTGRRKGETFFDRSTICIAASPALSRWIRRIRANVLAMSVFMLDVYLNDGSRIDFTAVSNGRPGDAKCHASREHRKSVRS